MNLWIETLAEMKVNFEFYFIVRYAPHWSLPIIFVNIEEIQLEKNNDALIMIQKIEIKLDSYKLF